MHGSKIAWLALVGCIAWCGCGQNRPETVAELESEELTESPLVEQPVDRFTLAVAEPASTIELFLESLRDGDDAITSRLLSTKAREETAKHDMVVRPPGSSTARFKVGQVVYTTDAKVSAHVESHWIDVDETGKKQSYEIVWILRRESRGWAVAGMATELFAGEAPLVMNFEKPQDMLAQQQRAELEMSRRNNRNYREVQTATHMEVVE
ncbi:MAG: hypothetical protein WDZ51_07485 [Pirellulaceae bacterium]